MINLQRARYEGLFAAMALAAIRTLRGSVQLRADEEDGMSFNNDAYVLDTLESHQTVAEFMHDVVGTVDLALHEAARADYWYSSEKSWEIEGAECEVAEDDDD